MSEIKLNFGKDRRSGNISSEQKKEMVEYMERHPNLQKGKFSNDFTYKKAQLLWEGLAKSLNALPGANKDWRQWRKVSDKYKSEKKYISLLCRLGRILK